MNSLSQRRVAVIGGGLSGLATATHLVRQNNAVDITLFESSGRVGGVIATECTEGFLIDHGADMFACQPSAALDLCRALGVEDQLIEPRVQRRGAMIVRNGKLVPVPDGFVLMRATKWWPLLKSPLLSPAGKLRFLAERWVTGQDLETDQSVGQFVRHRMGSEVLDRIVAPLVGGIYTADIDKLSMQATMAPIVKMVRQYGSLAKATSARKASGEDSSERTSSGARYNQFRAFSGGMQKLLDSLADALPKDSIRQSTAVTKLEPSVQDSSWLVHTSDKRQAFDQVVLATPARVSARLLENHATKASSQLGSIESSSVAIVVLALRRNDIHRTINTFGIVVPPIEGRRVIAISFASHKFDGRASDDYVLTRVFVGGSLQPELLSRDDSELVDLVQQELAELIGYQGDPAFSHVVRWNHSMPQYHVGHLQRVRQIEEDVAKHPGLHLVSNALHGVGIAPVIQSAKKVADRISGNQ